MRYEVLNMRICDKSYQVSIYEKPAHFLQSKLQKYQLENSRRRKTIYVKEISLMNIYKFDIKEHLYTVIHIQIRLSLKGKKQSFSSEIS